MTMNRPDECIGLPSNQMKETKKRNKNQYTPNVIMHAHNRGLQDTCARSLLHLLNNTVLRHTQLLLYQFHHRK
jgi:hypothetical protein